MKKKALLLLVALIIVLVSISGLVACLDDGGGNDLETKFTVTFVADGETVGTVTYTEKNKDITEPKVPKKDGYKGVWEEYELTTGNITVNAEYTAVEFTIKFMADGETVGTVPYTVEDTEITEPKVPYKDGYEGVWEEYELITGNITVNALYTTKGTTDGLIFQYKYNAYTVKGYNGTGKNVFIPSIYQNFPVTSIDPNAFLGCSSLTNVVIGNNVTSIGSRAFEGCSNLTSLKIPASVTSIGFSAFTNCSRLEGLYIEDIAAWCGIEFVSPESNPLLFAKSLYINNELATEIVISDTVISIGNFAFSGCSNLVSIKIPASVTSIGNFAFSGCSSLASIEIPASITSIGNFAFSGCISLKGVYIEDIAAWCGIKFGDYYSNPLHYSNKLYINSELATEIVIPDTVTSIGNYAFYGCSSLASIEIPSSVTSIGSSAFTNCSRLKGVYIEDIAAWCGIEFGDSSANPLYYANRLYINNELASEIVIPNTVTSIGFLAFQNCSSLVSIEIPSSVTSIGFSAFQSCSRLERITIPYVGATLGGTKNSHFGYIFGASEYSDNSKYVPKTLKTVIMTGGESIGSNAFDGCSSLVSVGIPSSVTSIGGSAFDGCSNLEGVYIEDIAAWCGIRFDISSANPLYYAKRLYINNELATEIVIPNTATSINSSAFSNCSSLVSVKISEGVTSIGSSAFSNCSSIVSIEIPSSVTSIGSNAFDGCISLEGVYIEDIAAWCGIRFESSSANPLYFAKRLYINNELATEIVIPNTVTSINSYAFENCSSLESIEIPTSVTSIGSNAFRGCSSLERITIPYVGATLGGTSDTHFGYIFGASSYDDNSKYVPKSLKTLIMTGGESIGERAFSECSSIETIEIPSSVISIGSYAFYGCSSLVGVKISEGVSSIGDQAFSECSSIVSIEIPEGVTSIGSNAFNRCNSLASIEIPNSVTIIGFSAFWGCSSLASIEIPNSVTTIDDYVFSGCSSLVRIQIPSGVTSIGDQAFNECSSLASIEIPNSVLSIGSSAFSRCSSIVSIEIPSSVTSIGYNAFSGCISLEGVYIEDIAAWCVIEFGDTYSNPLYYAKNLYINKELATEIVIPDTVTSIGYSAFEDCSSIESIEIPTSVTSIGSYAFRGCSSLESIEYNGTIAEWKAIEKGSNWNNNTGAYTVTCSDGTLTKSQS